MRDKRDECNCHRECTVLPHECMFPCRWPACLTWEEHAELADEIMRDELLGEVVADRVADEMLGDLDNWKPTGIRGLFPDGPAA